MLADVRERIALWFRLPEPPVPVGHAESLRGASRDRALPGKRRRAARRAR